MRAACRELKFGDEEGRENEIWLDYNADLVSELLRATQWQGHSGV